MRRRVYYILTGIAATVAAVIASAQWFGGREDEPEPNPPYDGRYAFARLRYAARPDDPCTCQVALSKGPAGWQHDYPRADRNIMHITTDLTTLNAHVDSTVVVTATDPQLMKYPIVYLSEPACWRPTEADVQALRRYLLKGGFLIVDDFSICTGGTVRFTKSREVFELQMRRVLPGGRLVPVSLADPALNGFFKLDVAKVEDALTRTPGLVPQVYGIYEDNDPKKRLLVAANYNTVIHRYWDWQADGLLPVEGQNEAYKLGVNYLIYGFTH